MNDLLEFLKLAVPQEPRDVVGYCVVGLLLAVGLIIARAERRNGRARDEADQLDGMDFRNAKLHENDGRNL